MQLGRLRQTHRDGSTLVSFTAGEEPGLPFLCPSPNQIREMVFIDLHSTVFQVSGKRIPTLQAVCNRLGRCVAAGYALALQLQPFVQIIEDAGAVGSLR